ncbi:DUF4199 domain-containing protein [Novosphingobium sp. B 225]|uniref:DUF4199 domain-containing protein n=1 Tax=Novosphingobium sp. B 225 TaxID=1961849 RepID=UPI000B4A7054|nr:DUF4199 domain-containing protein [Novosphingobium sp. B 225]
MQRLILVYGSIGGAILLANLAFVILSGVEGGALGMALGYLSMLIALSLVFVGVRKVRDEQRGGVIRFWPALGVGMAIAAVACLFYVLGWEAYMWATDYRFMAEYMASALAQKQASGASAADLTAFKAEMDAFAAMYANPLLRMLITLSEIAPIALLVPLISAMLLRNPRFLPAKV